jgi:hypothetical protein
MTWPRASLVQPVTIDQQATNLASYIDEHFTQERGGKTLVMESMWHLWEYILSAYDEPTVLVCCTGEQPRGSFAEQDLWHWVDRQWTVVLLRGHGFTSLEWTEKGQPARKEPLNVSIEALRETVRAMVGLSEEFPINFKGWSNLPAVARPGTANVFTAGALLTFSTANSIPEIGDPAET